MPDACAVVKFCHSGFLSQLMQT